MKKWIFAPRLQKYGDRQSFSPCFFLVFGFFSALLSGCVETVATVELPDPPAHAPGLARRDGVSPRGASLAFTAIDGLPQPLSDSFVMALDTAVLHQDLAIADLKSARYLTHGYLSAVPVQGGTSVSIIWDVTDAKKRHLQRIDDGILIAGKATGKAALVDGDPSGGPWALVDEPALARIAARSADDLAALLTNMPEAVAASASAARAKLAGNPPDGETSVAETPPAPAASAATNPAPARGFAALR